MCRTSRSRATSTIHVHKGCSPSRDWSLVARNVPVGPRSWRSPDFTDTWALDTTTCRTKAITTEAGRHPLCLRRDVRSGGTRALISTEGDATLADLNGCDEPGGCFCCNVGEVGISSTVKDPSSCYPHEPVYSCKPGIGCQYCPHPLACPGSTTKDKCDDSCNPTVRCIDNACVPCPDPYDCPGAVTPRTATRPASARRCTSATPTSTRRRRRDGHVLEEVGLRARVLLSEWARESANPVYETTSFHFLCPRSPSTPRLARTGAMRLPPLAAYTVDTTAALSTRAHVGPPPLLGAAPLPRARPPRAPRHAPAASGGMPSWYRRGARRLRSATAAASASSRPAPAGRSGDRRRRRPSPAPRPSSSRRRPGSRGGEAAEGRGAGVEELAEDRGVRGLQQLVDDGARRGGSAHQRRGGEERASRTTGSARSPRSLSMMESGSRPRTTVLLTSGASSRRHSPCSASSSSFTSAAPGTPQRSPCITISGLARLLTGPGTAAAADRYSVTRAWR